MHLARVAGICMVVFFLPLGGIVVVAIVLSYIEIYPLRTWRILGTDTLDPANERRSPD